MAECPPASTLQRRTLPPSLPAALCLLLLLGACSTVTTLPSAQVLSETLPAAAPAATLLAAAEEAPAGTAATPAEPADTTEEASGTFSEDVLSRAILAELAGQRGYNQQALDEYLALAQETGDLNIIKRTMRIATFMRNISVAMEMGRLWLEQEPDSVEARQTIALQLIATGRYREALTQLVLLMEQGSQVDFRLISARIATDQGAALFLNTLIGDFEALVQSHPRHESLRLALAHLYQQNEQIRQAYNLVQQLAREMDDAPEVVILEVQLLDLLGEPARAQRRLAQSLRSNPDHKQLRFLYGRKLIEQERYQDAREQFATIVEQYPDDYDMVYSLALLCMEVNLYSEARDYLQRLVTSGQRLDDAHFYLGFIANQASEADTAIEHYLRVTGGSNFLQAQRNLTELMIQAGRYPEVTAHLQNIRFRNADYNIPLLTMEANVLIEQGHQAEAAALLNSSIGAFPNNIQLLFLRSVLSQERNDLALMEQDLRKIIQLDPSSPVAYNSLGYILADRTNRFQEAYELILRASELAPNDPAIIDSLGWVQYRLGMFEEARRNLDRAYELYPDHEVAAHLGEVLWMMGDRSAATRIWRDALEVQPDSEHIRSAMERLNPDASI